MGGEKKWPPLETPLYPHGSMGSVPLVWQPLNKLAKLTAFAVATLTPLRKIRQIDWFGRFTKLTGQVYAKLTHSQSTDRCRKKVKRKAKSTRAGVSSKMPIELRQYYAVLSTQWRPVRKLATNSCRAAPSLITNLSTWIYCARSRSFCT